MYKTPAAIWNLKGKKNKKKIRWSVYIHVHCFEKSFDFFLLSFWFFSIFFHHFISYSLRNTFEFGNIEREKTFFNSNIQRHFFFPLRKYKFLLFKDNKIKNFTKYQTHSKEILRRNIVTTKIALVQQFCN